MSTQDQVPPAAAEITVPLIGQAVIGLHSLQNLTDCTRTDLVNRAVQLYAYLAGVQASGGKVCVQEPGRELMRLDVLSRVNHGQGEP